MPSARLYDNNGNFEVKNTPLARAGVFPYLGREIHPSLEPDRVYRVWRPEEELNNPETINSFNMVPWLPRHEMVGDGFTPPEEVGVYGTTGQEARYDDQKRSIVGNIKCYAKRLAEMISGGVKQLSMGLNCDYDFTSGVTPDGEPYDVIQRKLRANHLASVARGRMGPEVAVMDSAAILDSSGKTSLVISYAMDGINIDFETSPKGQKMDLKQLWEILQGLDLTPDQLDQVQKLVQGFSDGGLAPVAEGGDDGGEGMPPAPVEDEGGQPESADPGQEQTQKQGNAMDSEAITLLKQLGAKIGNLENEVSQIKSKPAMDEGAAVRAVEEKNALVKRAASILPDGYDATGKTKGQVAKDAIKAAGIACDSGMELATLNGLLAAQPLMVKQEAAKKQKAVALDTSGVSEKVAALLNL